MATEQEELEQKFSDKDLEAIRRVRSYYRRNFANGRSDQCFSLWMEDGLKLLELQEQGKQAETK